MSNKSNRFTKVAEWIAAIFILCFIVLVSINLKVGKKEVIMSQVRVEVYNKSISDSCLKDSINSILKKENIHFVELKEIREKILLIYKVTEKEKENG